MATVNVMLRKSKPLKDGDYPLVIVITTGSNKRRYITVGSATEIQWNASKCELNQKHSDFVRINRVINKRVSEIKDTIMEFEMRGDTPTIDDLVKPRAIVRTDLFKDAANNKRAAFLEAGKPGTYKRYGGIIDKFLEYAGDGVRFADISSDTITGFKKFMEAKGNKANTIASNFVVLKGILKEGKLDVDTLFEGIRMREVDVFRDRLSIEEIRSIEAVSIEERSEVWKARQLFMFSFYAWGMRFRDVCLLRKSNINGNELSYLTSKSNFTKRISLILEPEAMDILKSFSYHTGHYLFPILKREFPALETPPSKEDKAIMAQYKKEMLQYENAVGGQNYSVNRNLKIIALRAKIDKDIHFHLSRHSFVDILKQNGVSAEIRMQMVGHNSEKIHNKYHGEFDREKLSEISRKILSPKGDPSSS